jgi:hypothetical protein
MQGLEVAIGSDQAIVGITSEAGEERDGPAAGYVKFLPR